MPYNFTNPEMGPVYDQLYVRQALQHAVDQETISEVVWHGAAKPDYGPVPQASDTTTCPTTQKNNPYPFDLDAAAKLLDDHGWKAGSDGTLECSDAGTGATQCGEGIDAGKKMEIMVSTQNGSQETDNMMSEIKSSLGKIGVEMTIRTPSRSTPSSPRRRAARPARASAPGNWRSSAPPAVWYFSAYPTGERVFAKDTVELRAVRQPRGRRAHPPR